MGKERILLVDDEREIRLLMKDILEFNGMEVDAVNSGRDALELISVNNYDYICSDVKMPVMSGIEFVTKAREITGNKSQYFYITGVVTNDIVEQMKEGLIDGYLEKPFTEESLVSTFCKR